MLKLTLKLAEITSGPFSKDSLYLTFFGGGGGGGSVAEKYLMYSGI